MGNQISMVDVPEGKSGDWEIKRFVVSVEDLPEEVLRVIFSGRGVIRPGIYTSLLYKGDIVMSDTPDELKDCAFFVQYAKETVLINGLGMGAVLESLLCESKVRHIVVIEIDSNVIKLVAEHYQKKAARGRVKLEIIHDDALTWKNKDKLRFNAVWHDIWPAICADNLFEMKKLHRRVGHWLAKGGYQMSWAREYCEIMERRGY